MTGRPYGRKQARSGTFMYIFGGVILVCVVLWYSFSAIDRIGLQDQTSKAKVITKEHRDGHQGYTTDVIAGKARTVPRVVPEMYILKLNIGGREAISGVDKALYNTVNPQDEVQVTYQQRRLTGGLQVVSVTR